MTISGLTKSELEYLKNLLAKTNVAWGYIPEIAAKIDSAIKEMEEVEKIRAATYILAAPLDGDPSVMKKEFYLDHEEGSRNAECRYAKYLPNVFAAAEPSIVKYIKDQEAATRRCSKCAKEISLGYHLNNDIDYLCNECFPSYMDNLFGNDNWQSTSDLKICDKKNPACEGDHLYVVRDSADSDWRACDWEWTVWEFTGEF